ncbi:MAG: hypothetical protein ACOCZ6_05220 [Nanoarchaeota archaeon]
MQGTVYDKYRKIFGEVKKAFPEIDQKEFFRITSKLSTWHYPKKRWDTMTLSKQETAVYEWMLNNEYNPSTVYKWMLAMNTTKDIQNKMKKGTVSLKQAIKCGKPYKHVTEVEAEFMYHIKQCIQRYVIR